VGRLGEIPDFTRFLFEDVDPEPDLLDRRILQAAEGALAVVDDWTASELEAALKRLCEELGEKPRTVFAPIRVAVTGSRVSPGLYESLELLGRETTLERLRSGEELAA
jgi:glutamyl-tRNA synthetase